MDGITLLIFHIIVIGAVVATTFIIAFSAGKKEGIRSILKNKRERTNNILQRKYNLKLKILFR